MALTMLHFAGADLRGENFSGADLTETNFRKAVLVDANFSYADLSNADLSGAKINGANFTGAKLNTTLRTDLGGYRAVFKQVSVVGMGFYQSRLQLKQLNK